MQPIEKARKYIRTKVIDPALNHPKLSDNIKRKVKNANLWLDQFERVGDIILYLRRFEHSKDSSTYQAMHDHQLATFEDIAHLFEKEFSLWINDCTRPTDFIVGNRYSGHQILIFSRNYDTRAGGMFVLNAGDQPSAVVIKATLTGGRYANLWLDEPRRLKYYLKSIGNEFGEHFKANAAILANPHIPILAFVRSIKGDLFTYQGIFKYSGIQREPDGSKWFELERDDEEAGVVEDSSFSAEVLAEKIKVARQSSREKRLERLANAQKKPLKIQLLSIGFVRNPDVIAEVLYRAAGQCESCGHPAPFNRKSDGTPYLEVHHRTPLAQDGDDTVENGIALCPNCHRKAHFG